MSEPDVPPGQRGAKTAKISLPDDNLGITPPGPRQMDFGTFSTSFIFKGLGRQPNPAAGCLGFESQNRLNRVGP
jgi:hypothetical protein